MATELTNSIDIRSTPEAVYQYVTQPWKWHEWHPNSRSATGPGHPLKVGDTFNEVIELQPLSPLPVRMRRETAYQVLEAEPFRAWTVEGQARDGWLRIRYRFRCIDGGTRFTRTLVFQTRGLSRVLMLFLKKRMARQSLIALTNLRNRLEAGVGT
jgi:hypothetical protein